MTLTLAYFIRKTTVHRAGVGTITEFYRNFACYTWRMPIRFSNCIYAKEGQQHPNVCGLSRSYAQRQKDFYPLSQIHEVWQTFAKAKYFAALDLLIGYHNVNMQPKNKLKTTLVTYKKLLL